MNWFSLTEHGKALSVRLRSPDLDLFPLRSDLDKDLYTPDEINRAFLDYVCEIQGCTAVNAFPDAIRTPGLTVPGYSDSRLLELTELFLEYGLDPNLVIRDRDNEEWNIMHEVIEVFNGWQAADSLRLLLSRGGDPNMEVDYRFLLEKALDCLEMDLDHPESVDDMNFDAYIHCIMVIIGFGGTTRFSGFSVQPAEGFDSALLRDHWNYTFGFVRSTERNQGMDLCFFDKPLKREVARCRGI